MRSTVLHPEDRLHIYFTHHIQLPCPGQGSPVHLSMAGREFKRKEKRQKQLDEDEPGHQQEAFPRPYQTTHTERCHGRQIHPEGGFPVAVSSQGKGYASAYGVFVQARSEGGNNFVWVKLVTSR